MSKGGRTNPRLAGEPSPYLREAAHQPVDWFPWSDEAFAKAMALDRPILLDIGAVWCHWCHVMDGESYEDPETAAVINERFVAIKVDRDERPDVDSRYQRLVGAVTGQGGWPLTGFLTPEGRVFWGGTYFPPKETHGRPGFRDVLLAVANAWKDRRQQCAEQAEHIESHALAERTPSRGDAVTPEWVRFLQDVLLQQNDPSNGGWGGAPKFPHPSAVEFLLATSRGHQESDDIVQVTLDRMAEGGIRDHVGGGWHRYSVDAEWIVPHFEKMLYDNAELLRNYTLAHARWGLSQYAEVAHETVRFLREALFQAETGVFGGSQDADVAFGDDGDFFTWTRDEVREAVGDEDLARLVFQRFAVEEHGPMHHNHAKNVLHVVADVTTLSEVRQAPEPTIAAKLETAMTALRKARAKRKAPFVDPVGYTNWNGMAIRALIEHADHFGDDASAELALKALATFNEQAWDPKKGYTHTVGGKRVEGILDDQAQMLCALVVAFMRTREDALLKRAVALGHLMIQRFWDPSVHAFRDVADPPKGGPSPLARPDHPIQDSPSPSANARAAQGLRMLAALTGEDAFATPLRALADAWASEAKRLGLFACALAQQVDASLEPPPHVLVAGPSGATQALHASALRLPWPGLTVRVVDASTPKNAMRPEVAAFLAGPGRTEAAALVCVGERCLAPERDPVALERLLGDAFSGKAPL